MGEQILDAASLAPTSKLKTIVDTAAALELGESLILHNNRDLQSLKHRFEAEYQGQFLWQYIKQGPDVFEVRITKKKNDKPMEEYVVNGVLDATRVPMRIKHETIIQTAVALKEGDSFILRNDHDPIPLKYQFDAEYPEQFSWDYIKKGPDVFEIKISKIKSLTTEASLSNPKDPVLDAIALDASVKFQTIMKTFNGLKEGEAFILHNDHDPKPLYYKLTADQGDSFTWEYVKQGPEIFEIRIGKKPVSMPVKGEEKVLDAICVDASVKLQTIMKTFNDLQPGEGFILHNDHDPKPLYYKLTADQGDSFTWEYLKQGPEIFEIRIAKKAVTSSAPATSISEADLSDHIIFDDKAPVTLRTIAAKDYRKTYIFRDHDIDFAWNGNRSLTEACKDAQVSEAELREELSLAEEDFSLSVPSQDYYHWNMAFLADFILATHHKYVRENAERISALAERVAVHFGSHSPALKELGLEVRPMIDDFMTHMSKEENVLFPAIKEMLKLMHEGKRNAGPGGAMANAVVKMEAEHDETRQYLEKFRRITNHYEAPADASDLQKQLYHELQQFENDTYMHVHLENNILFPKMILLEEKISR